MTTWMLYGANGYTGVLIAEEAVRRGITPILAGRRAGAVRPLADRLGCEARIFSLEDPAEVDAQFRGVGAVLLAAGPFSQTTRPVLEACLRAGIHYVDITGEIEVFEMCRERDAEARRRGSVVLPGAGMDVVPSDCLAASLSEALPGAVSLEMALAGTSSVPGGTAGMDGFSRGTRKTMVEGIALGGFVRENGKLKSVPLGWKTARIPFRDRERTCVTISWGDLSTAFHSTGIPNITIYMAMPSSQVSGIRLMSPFAPVLRWKPLQRAMQSLIGALGKDPDARSRETTNTQFWGRVTDAAGRSREGTLAAPNGYTLTVLTALDIVERVAAGKARPGFKTPSSAFGKGYISTFPGCDLRIA